MVQTWVNKGCLGHLYLYYEATTFAICLNGEPNKADTERHFHSVTLSVNLTTKMYWIGDDIQPFLLGYLNKEAHIIYTPGLMYSRYLGLLL